MMLYIINQEVNQRKLGEYGGDMGTSIIGKATDQIKDKWENGEHASLKHIVNGLLKQMGPIKIKDGKNIIEMDRTFKTHPMPHQESDVTIEGEEQGV